MYLFRKRLSLICCVALLGSTQVIAQVYREDQARSIVPASKIVRLKNDRINYIQFAVPEDLSGNNPSSDFLTSLLRVKPDYQFYLIRKESDAYGDAHYRYRQTYKGIPIEGCTYLIHTKDGKIVSVNGEYIDQSGLNAMAAISESDALQIALKNIHASVYKWELEHEEQWLKAHEKDANATFFPKGQLCYAPVNIEGASEKERNYRLSYKFDIYADQPLSKDLIYVDALDGKIIRRVNQIKTGDTLAVAETRYSGTQTITADYTGTQFRLRDGSRGMGITTYDLNKSTNYNNGVDFVDADNYWNNINPQNDEVATDAHHGSEMTYDYYLNVHSRISIDNNGQSLDNYVHYSSGYNNAFWDGLRMTYGDGDGSNFYPLTCLDVAGHEMSHGLTDYTANLIYQAESGGLNESFSDIFGNAVEFYGKTGNWRMGEDITVNPGKGIRNMANPNEFSDPDTYKGTFWVNTNGACNNGNDQCGVHTNSGVQNFWFYLLTEGGTGVNDNNNNYSVTAIGIEKAGRIAFRNLTIYLTEFSNYADSRFYSIQSAIDLYGDCSQEVISTTDAWYAVGVGAAYAPPALDIVYNATPTVNCFAPVTVEFTNLTRGADSFLWKFGDGKTSTDFNPCHIYEDYGTYNLTLIAYGGTCGNGVDSLVVNSAVDLNTSNGCNLTMNQDAQGCQQTACNGSLKDAGGTSNYNDNSTAWITIKPTNASSITLNFNSFSYESNYDYLYIYDGPTDTSPLIGQYSGNGLPNGGSITSTGGAVTIKHYSDVYTTQAGFDLNWTCAASLVAMPVHAIQLKATDHVSGVHLDWHVDGTVSENGDFRVKRSTNGTDFETIGTVKAMKNQVSSDYTFIDIQPDWVVPICYYKIELVENEKEVVSNKVLVSKKRPAETETLNVFAFPNPSLSGIFNLRTNSTTSFPVQIKITNILGELVKEITVTDPGIQVVDLSRAGSGVYVMEASNTTEKLIRKLVVK